MAQGTCRKITAGEFGTLANLDVLNTSLVEVFLDSSSQICWGVSLGDELLNFHSG